MEILSLEEENIIKDIRNLFRLKREQNYTGIKNIRNLFRFKKTTKVVKVRILGDINSLFEYQSEKNYHMPVRVSNFGVTIIWNKKVTVIKINHH